MTLSSYCLIINVFWHIHVGLYQKFHRLFVKCTYKPIQAQNADKTITWN